MSVPLTSKQDSRHILRVSKTLKCALYSHVRSLRSRALKRRSLIAAAATAAAAVVGIFNLSF